MKRLIRIVRWSILVLALIQLVPVKRTNPPVETEVPAPDGVRSVLRRACYNCHSNETVWPWYSRVAPVSWLVAFDVSHGREEVNFSTWNRLSATDRDKAFRKIIEEVDEEEMPPWQYTPLHPEARLTKADRSLLVNWARSGASPVP